MLAVPQLASGAVILRHRLDQMNIDYSGMDINNDDIPDFIRMNILRGGYTVYVGSETGRPITWDPAYLAAEDRKFFPDIIKAMNMTPIRIRWDTF